MQENKPWTPQEIMTLRRLFGVKGPKESAKALGRTVYGVRAKARQLGIPGVGQGSGACRADRHTRGEAKGFCLHCGTLAGMRPRRLCWRCHDKPAVRGRYPLLTRFTKREDGRASSGVSGACEAAMTLDLSKLPPPPVEPDEVLERRMARARQLGEAVMNGPECVWSLESVGWTKGAVNAILKESPEWLVMDCGEIALTERGRHELRIGDMSRVAHSGTHARKTMGRRK